VLKLAAVVAGTQRARMEIGTSAVFLAESDREPSEIETLILGESRRLQNHETALDNVLRLHTPRGKIVA
jgi:hypothetical protein